MTNLAQAVVNYHKEGSPSKKLTHYTRILVIQLAAEQRMAHDAEDRMTAIQFRVAREQMKQAFEAPVVCFTTGYDTPY